MFKSGQTNPYDEVVSECFYRTISTYHAFLLTLATAKTTDENLTSENWELILNLCDKVQDEGQEGSVPTARFPIHKLTVSSARIMSSLPYSSV